MFLRLEHFSRNLFFLRGNKFLRKIVVPHFRIFSHAFLSLLKAGVGIVENLDGTRYSTVPKNFLAGTRSAAVPKIFKFDGYPPVPQYPWLPGYRSCRPLALSEVWSMTKFTLYEEICKNLAISWIWEALSSMISEILF